MKLGFQRRQIKIALCKLTRKLCTFSLDVCTLVPSVFVPFDQRSGTNDPRSFRQASMRSKERRLEVRDCVLVFGLESKGLY